MRARDGRARLSPLSSCHRQPLLLQQSRAGGKRPAAGPAAAGIPHPRGLPFARAARELARALAAGRDASIPGAAGDLGFPQPSVAAPLGASPLSPCCRSSAPSGRGERSDRCLCAGGEEPYLVPRPPAASAAAGPPLARAAVVLRALPHPPHPPRAEVVRPPLPGWGKCALGRLHPGALTRRLVPTGPVQRVGGALHGGLKRPGNPASLPRGARPVGFVRQHGAGSGGDELASRL